MNHRPTTHKPLSRVLALLLCMIFVITLLPAPAHADYEDGMDCPECGKYHWDDWLACDECGICIDCIDEFHFCKDCEDCCYNKEVCQGCGMCEDCILICPDCGEHCADCDDYTCLACGRCSGCNADTVCYVCFNTCFECENHQQCGNCYKCRDCVDDICDDCEEHCTDCDDGFCWNCGTCSSCNGDTTCPDCHESCDECNEGCYECHRCPDCTITCEDCGELCMECDDGFCLGCNLCSNCNGETACPDCHETCFECNSANQCLDCMLCESCAYLCVSCGEVCMDCDDAFCENCATCSSCNGETACPGCYETCLECCNKAQCRECYYCADCTTVCDGCGDICVDCDDEFCLNCCYCESCNGGTACPSCHETCDNCANHPQCKECLYCSECVLVCESCCEICESCDTGFDVERCLCSECQKDEFRITKQPESVTASSGDTATFRVEAEGHELSYQWEYSDDGGKTWNNSSSISSYVNCEVIIAKDGRLYRCIITDGYGRTRTSKSAKLTVDTVVKPVIKTQPKSIAALAAETVKFTVSATGGKLTYQWQFKAPGTDDWYDSSMTGAKTATLTVPVTAARNGQLYRCIVKNSAGKTTSNSAKLTVITKPTITTQPKSVTAAAGDTVTFTVKASGEGLSYQWQFKAPGTDDWYDSSMTGAKTNTLSVSVTAARNGQKYRCVVKNVAGSTPSQAATLTVKETVKPAITTQPKNIQVAAGNTAKFTVAASGGKLSYQWQYQSPGTSSWNNSSMTGAKTNTLSVPATVERNGQKYCCVVKNASGTATSSAAILTVVTKPVINAQPKSISAGPGDNVTFTITASGTAMSYQWQFKAPGESAWNNSSMAGAKTATLYVTATTARNGQQYRCVVKNAAGSVTSSAATLTVASNLKPSITNQPKSTTAISGATATFYVAAKGGNLTYQWQFKAPGETAWNNSSMTGAKTATLSVPATMARSGQQYRCVVKNGNGSVTSSAATLTVIETPKITTQPTSRTAAAGDTIKFTVKATGGALTYQWQFKAAGTSTWNNSSMTGAKTATLSVPATAARSGQQYRCIVKNAAGKVTSSAATLTVKETVKPSIITQPKSATAAAGDSVKFTVAATGVALTYQWQFKAPGTSTWNNSTMTGAKTKTLTVSATMARSGQQYRCVVKNASGTVTSSAATLTVKETVKPAITTQPKSQTAAAGQTVKFTVKATGGKLTYQWQFKAPGADTWNNSTMTGAKTATLSVPATAARNGQQYRCIIKNASGTVTSTSAKLTVK